MEVIQHHPCILKEIYIGLGIGPSDDNEDESESEPMSSDDDSNAESFVSLDSYRSWSALGQKECVCNKLDLVFMSWI